jgi:RNA polymerase sigma-70 factor (ECF subfamily)
MLPQALRGKDLPDEKEFTQQIFNLKDKFFIYFNSITKNESMANDLFQELFLTAHKQYVLGLYIEKGKLYNYLMRIATNISRDYFRMNKRHHNGFTNYQTDICSNFGWSEPTCDYLTKTIKEKDIEIRGNIADRLLDNEFNLTFLNSDEQCILKMRHGKNFSFTKISETLNVPTATIAFKYRIALKKIREAIQQGVVR